MKTLLTSILFFFTLLNSAQTKRAFLVGIGNYEKANLGWKNIDGDTDITKHLKPFLIHNGFINENIDTLINEEATLIGFQNKAENFIEKIKPDDHVFIYFATHGQQITDLDNDEIHDNLDESIVLYDTPLCKTITNYKGEKHLTDDVLKKYLKRIRLACGEKGQVFLGVDACFSGDIDKLLEVSTLTRRGTDDECTLAINEVKNSTKDNNELGELEYNEALLSPFILLSASSSNEVNYQVKDKKIGSLTYALTKKVFKNELETTSFGYKYLFSKIKDAYKEINYKNNKNQNPVCNECTTFEQEQAFIFDTISFKKHYFITSNFNTGNTYKTWNYGKLHGFSKGAIFEVKNRKDSLLAYAKILDANALKSSFYLNKKTPFKELSNAVFIPIQLNYLSNSFSIQINSNDYKVLDTLFTLKKSLALHNKNSKYKLEVNNNFFNVYKNDRLFIHNKSIKNIESEFVYLSYLDYLNELNVISKEKFIQKEGREFSLNEKIKLKKHKSKVYLNNGFDTNKELFFSVFSSQPFELAYPNNSVIFYDAFLSKKKSRSPSFKIKQDVNYNLIFLEKNKKYILDLSRSIFNYNYAQFHTKIKRDLIFPNTSRYKSKISKDENIKGFYLYTNNKLH